MPDGQEVTAINLQVLWAEGRRRYHDDAAFHARVEQAVSAAMMAFSPTDPPVFRIARNVATEAVVLALHHADNGS